MTGYAYWTSHNTYPTVFTTDAGLLASYPNVVFLAAYSATGLWRLYVNGNDNYSGNTISDSTCYFFDIRGTSSNLTLIINGTTEINASEDATWKGSDLRIGYNAFGGAGMTGYVEDFQFFDSAATPTPTVTMTNSPGSTNTFTVSPTITQTFTITKTITQTFTVSPTPTPSPTPVFMARFTPYASNPILTPGYTWETGNTSRLSARVDDDDLIKGVYAAGPYSSHPGPALNTFTAADPLNPIRTGVNPVIGSGYGGQADSADRATFYIVGPGWPYTNGGTKEYRVYYQKGSNPTDIYLSTSPDFVTWTDQGSVIAAGISGPSNVTGGWNSVGIYYDGSKFLITAQGACNGACDVLFQSTDGKTGFTYVTTLMDLQQGYSPPYSGRSFFAPASGTQNNQIQDFFTMRDSGITLSGVTNIYHALAINGLQNEIVAPDPAENLGSVSTTSNVQMANPDGLIGPCLVPWHGKCYLYYTIYDNTNLVHRIGVSTFYGRIDNLFLNNTDTPTPTISPTFTTTPTPSMTSTVTPLPTATACTGAPCGNWWDIFRRRRRGAIPGPVLAYDPLASLYQAEASWQKSEN
jgi:hypothetical protein